MTDEDASSSASPEDMPLDQADQQVSPAPVPANDPVAAGDPVAASDPVVQEPAAAQDTNAPGADPPTDEPAAASEPSTAEPTELSTPEPTEPATPEPTEPSTPEPPAAEPPAPTPSADPAAVPAPGPAAVPPSTSGSEPPAKASDPSEWGRVADDGTVFVRTPDGEREVGSYPGASPEEALAYFGRKYDELSGQVTLLERRVVSGKANLADAQASVAALQEGLPEAKAVGDLEALRARLDQLTIAIDQRKARRDAERAKAREKAVEQKQRIVAEAESLAESGEWKKTGDRLKSLLDEWKAAPRLDRKTDDALWKRFSVARTAFDKRRRAHFAELDEQREEASTRKEKLVKEAEALATSTEWGDTSRRFRDLMTQWKAAGRAKRDAEDALWARFKAAQDAFFAARNEVFSARDADQAENLEKKRALAGEAEALLPVADPKAARRALRGIHDRWEAVGHVPRNARDQVEGRLRKVEDAVREAEQSAWKRSNPEARARAEDTVNQLRTSIAKLEREAAAARAAGNEKKAAEAEQAAAIRTTWLVEAEKTLTEFS